MRIVNGRPEVEVGEGYTDRVLSVTKSTGRAGPVGYQDLSHPHL